jgi:ketosteroid isomerase-like protein
LTAPGDRAWLGRVEITPGAAMNATLTKLRDIMNTHDANAMASLYSLDYRSEQPAHPNRGFTGHAQVAENWANMFRGVPDMTVELLAEATDDATVWSEWVLTGHHMDGSPFEMCGVIIMGLTDDGLIAEQRLYLEPVERDGAAIEETVQQLAKPER